jgi:superfamily II DNA or RNA helicase
VNLRPYQEASIEAIENEWQTVDKTLLVLPTGTGKTIVFSRLTHNAVARGGRVLILAHRDELLRQAQDKLLKSTGLASAIEKAGEYAGDCMESVIVGSVQTLLSPTRRANLPVPTHIIVDEAHHILSESYQTVVGHWDRAKVLGVTATPDRGDMRNLGRYFDSLAFEYTLPEAIAQGYLCPIKVLTCPMKLDVSKVRQSAGDLQAGDLGAALDPYLPGIAQEIAAQCRERKGMIFTPLCSTAQKLQDYLKAEGVRAYYASGEYREEIAAFEQDGQGSVIINAMLLTEGYDHPSIDMICVLRMTKIRSLFAQMVGRGTRPSPGKENLLLLDFLWNCEKHDLVRPAHLLAEDEEVAQAMTAAYERNAGTDMDLEEALEKAKSDVAEARESKLASRIAQMQHRKRELVDPLQFAASIRDPDLMSYFPAFGAEMAAPSDEQVKALADLGIYPGDITSAGHAQSVLTKLNARIKQGLARPKQIRKLEQYGYEHVGEFKASYASHLISRIAANGWRLPDEMVEQVRRIKAGKAR